MLNGRLPSHCLVAFGAALKAATALAEPPVALIPSTTDIFAAPESTCVALSIPYTVTSGTCSEVSLLNGKTDNHFQYSLHTDNACDPATGKQELSVPAPGPSDKDFLFWLKVPTDETCLGISHFAVLQISSTAKGETTKTLRFMETAHGAQNPTLTECVAQTKSTY